MSLKSSSSEKGEIFKVYFVDGSFKSIKVDPKKTTIEELWEIVSDKLGLTLGQAEFFFIWGIEEDLELLLFAESTINDCLKEWDDYKKRWSNRNREVEKDKTNVLKKTIKGLKKVPSAQMLMPSGNRSLTKVQSMSQILDATAGNRSGFRFVFRPTSIIHLRMERNIKSDVVTNLFYIEAVYNVVNSRYPCDFRTALDLAGLQAQVHLGDHNPDLHKPGHLGDAILKYIPRHLHNSKSLEEWEDLVYTEHKKHKGKTVIISQLLYLQLVRQWIYYGCTFFDAQYRPPTQGFYTQEFAGSVVIGINQYGIHIIDPLAMKVISVEFSKILDPYSDDSSFSFSEIQQDKKNPPKLFMFKTYQGDLINDLLHDWMAEIKHQTEALNAERKRQETIRNLEIENKSKRKSKRPGTFKKDEFQDGKSDSPKEEEKSPKQEKSEEKGKEEEKKGKEEEK